MGGRPPAQRGLRPGGKTEDRQRSGVRSQGAEIRDQKSEVRLSTFDIQTFDSTEDRDQGSEVRGQKSEISVSELVNTSHSSLSTVKGSVL
jgi:hypothetical protein